MATQRASRTTTVQEQPTPAEPTPRLFTVDEYYKMAEAGILGPDEHVELIEGVIVQMPPIGPRHAFNVNRLVRLFLARLGDRAEVSIQNPVRLRGHAEPEPDLAVVRMFGDDPRHYESRHPVPEDVYFVLEIAATSASYDLGEKAEMYARHGIPELWVVDLVADRLVVHRDPTPDGYASVTVAERGATVTALAFPDVTFTADEILG
jgi:Uma2 family endonuclease